MKNLNKCKQYTNFFKNIKNNKMNTIRPCGCKGVRTCLKCEQDYDIQKTNLLEVFKKFDSWSWCIKCERFYPNWECQIVQQEHPEHNHLNGIELPGIFVKEDFISSDEGTDVINSLDALPWCISQSGRRKQNFGPKTNFKKKKLQNGLFNGFPKTTQFLQEKLKKYELLQDFQTIEQCSLEYDPSKGASIDPHIDDCWIWGERVVTVNCLGDAVLTLTLYNQFMDEKLGKQKKYNLDLVSSYENKLINPLLTPNKLKVFQNKVLRIPMPNLSLMVLYGPARYQFEHSVLREDVVKRRVCLAYREFTPMYLKDGESYDKGCEVTQNATHFWLQN